MCHRVRPMTHITGAWCSGSIPDCRSVGAGSIPVAPAKKESVDEKQSD